MPGTQVAAQLYTVREFMRTPAEFAASMRKIRAIGYRAVQVSAIGDIADAEVKRIADDNGLAICATHSAWDDLLSNLDAVIAQHQRWDCRHVALGSMPQEYRRSEAGFRRFAEVANGIGERLADAGLTFSYHNHSFEFVKFGGRTGLALLYEETDPRYLQAELDTYWIQHGGADPAAWIERLAGRQPIVHLKDMALQTGESDWRPQQVFAEVGAGNLNWERILAACQRAGVEWYAVEQDICPGDPFESLAISYKNLRALGLS